jgi:hypothetical protein
MAGDFIHFHFVNLVDQKPENVRQHGLYHVLNKRTLLFGSWPWLKVL